jgi:LPS sulfotransferase NodH
LEPAHLVATLFPNPRYIWLRRRDKVRQAVSRCKALQTTIWISRTSREAREDPRFDFEQIETIVQQIEVWEAGWQTYFDTYNLDPLVLYYEDFVTALDTTLFTILDHLDIPFPPDMECPLPQTEKMADEMSEAWVQQYYAIKQSQTDRHLPDGCLRDKDLSPPLNGYTDSINVINEKA